VRVQLEQNEIDPNKLAKIAKHLSHTLRSDGMREACGHCAKRTLSIPTQLTWMAENPSLGLPRMRMRGA